jgi:hypothetical protein
MIFKEREIIGHKREEFRENWRKLHNIVNPCTVRRLK